MKSIYSLCMIFLLLTCLNIEQIHAERQENVKEASPKDTRHNRTNLLALNLPPSVLVVKKVAFIVTGQVTDDKNEPLVGASVVLEGTTKGTLTDDKGNYSLELTDAEKNGTLVFSFVGYDKQSVAINGRNDINIILTEGGVLNQVVVIGYGTEKNKICRVLLLLFRRRKLSQYRLHHLNRGYKVG